MNDLRVYKVTDLGFQDWRVLLGFRGPGFGDELGFEASRLERILGLRGFGDLQV